MDLSEELSTYGRKNTFAKALFSFTKKESDAFWSDAPTRIFIDAFDRVILEQNKDIKDLYDFLCRQNMKELRDELKGYVSARFFDPSNSRTSSAVMSKIISCIGWLEHISIQDKPRFSIKSFCENIDNDKKGGWLFISAPRDTRHLFQDLNNALLNLATTSIMELDPKPERRLWIIMDELASFDTLTDMSTSVAELRKYGGCVLSATQNLNQLNNIYGHFITKAMLDQN